MASIGYRMKENLRENKRYSIKNLLQRGVFIFMLFSFLSTSLPSQEAKKLRLNTSMATEKDTDQNLLNVVSNTELANSSKDYLVTPGDVYTLSYAIGNTPVSYPIVVDNTYRIKVSNLASINATGKTFVELKKQVEEIVNRNYPLGGGQLVITKTSVFKVTIKGEVAQTVIKHASALDRLSNVYYDGLTSFSSDRKVTVISSSGVRRNYDLFKARRGGDLSQDPYLRPDDTVIVNRAERKVTIYGAVERTGTYELLEGENLKDLVEVYGAGLLVRADTSRIEISRILDADKSSGRRIYLDNAAIEGNYPLLNYDIVSIASYDDLSKVMFLEGAVRTQLQSEVETAGSGMQADISGKLVIHINDNTRYAFLVRAYSGYYLPTADLKNAYITRGDDVISIDMEKILYDPSYYSDFTVEEYDTLNIPFKQYFVTVAGAVNLPARYPYIPDRGWEYYIGLAGGFNTDKNTMAKIKIVDMNGKKHKKKEAILPEYTITASSNSFTYYFSKYAPVVTTLLTAASTIATLVIAVQNAK